MAARADSVMTAEHRKLLANLQYCGGVWVEFTYHQYRDYGVYDRVAKLAYLETTKTDPLAMYGWIESEVLDPKACRPDAPWDFTPTSCFKDEFVRGWYVFDKLVGRYGVETAHSLKIIDDIDGHPRAAVMKAFRTADIYRIAGDSTVTFGDGGEATLCYPIYKIDHLPIADSTRHHLVSGLLALNELRRDRQPSCIVEDIIDPDLAPRLLPMGENAWTENELRRLERRSAAAPDHSDMELRLSKRSVAKGAFDDLTDATKIRESYSWVPTDVLIRADGDVQLLSPIHNLPAIPENKSLYNCIGKVFRAMVPMFAKLNLVPEGEEATLQVVIKAQSYVLEPSQTYSGRWHTEGCTENIVAAGVYYCNIDEGLKGGNLKFRPAYAPAQSYKIATDVEVEVKQGAALVFSNTIPHRFTQMVNQGVDDQRRLFLNFFVLDPTTRVPSTTTQVTMRSARMYILIAATRCHRYLPSELVYEMMSYLPELWPADEVAKAFRQKAREAMKQTRSGWGYIHYGNCGISHWVQSLDTWELKQQCRNLKHTESGGGVPGESVGN